MLARLMTLAALCGALLAAGCGGGGGGPRELAAYPLDSLEEILDSDEDLAIDHEIHTDGRASLRVTAARPRVVRLFALENPGVDDCLLVWRARLRCEALRRRVFLETWVRLPGTDEYFGRGLESAIGRTTDWREAQAIFRLEKGQVPDRVRLNLVIEGEGKVWIDDVRLTVAPLPR